MELGNDRIICRYCYLHPEVEESAVRELFSTGGLHYAELFTGQDFCSEIVSRLETLISEKR